jgi:hypothetical protein
MSEKLRMRGCSSSATATLAAASHARPPSAAQANIGADRQKFFMGFSFVVGGAISLAPRMAARHWLGPNNIVCTFIMETPVCMVGISLVDAVDDVQSRRDPAGCPWGIVRNS